MPAGEPKDPLLIQVGLRVKARRNDLGLTQQDLAARLVRSRSTKQARSTIANVETGRQNMTLGTIVALCEELKVSADWLLGVSGTGEPILADPIRQAAVEDTIAVFQRAFDTAALTLRTRP